MIAGVLLLAAFVAWERRARMPMLPLSLFTSGQFTAANVVTFAVYGALGGATVPAAHRTAAGIRIDSPSDTPSIASDRGVAKECVMNAFRIDTDLTETGYSVGAVRMPADFPGRGP
jgi:hypothetical protein